MNKTEPNLEVRLGAIYALDRIARDSERDHWPIMEVLCAYIRNSQNCGNPLPFPGAPESKSKTVQEWLELTKPRMDVQAAITVIGHRSKERVTYERQNGFSLDLSGANLQRVVMKDTDFSRARFVDAHLDGAMLANACLAGTSFGGARLHAAYFDEANLDQASFTEAVLNVANFSHCNLRGASFSKANLSGATFVSANLENATFEYANITGVNFSSSKLHDVSFEGVRIDISFTQMARPNFVEADFGNWSKPGSRFSRVELFEIDFSRSLGLKAADLVTAFGDATTRLPPGMLPPNNWPTEVLNAYQRIDFVYQKPAH